MDRRRASAPSNLRRTNPQRPAVRLETRGLLVRDEIDVRVTMDERTRPIARRDVAHLGTSRREHCKMHFGEVMPHLAPSGRTRRRMRVLGALALIAALASATSVGAALSDIEANQRRKAAAKTLLSEITLWAQKNGCLPEISRSGMSCSQAKGSAGSNRLSIDGGVSFEKHLPKFAEKDPTSEKAYTQVNLPIPPTNRHSSEPLLSTDQIFVGSGLSCTKKADWYTTSTDPKRLVAVYRLSPVSKVRYGCVTFVEH
ncbi:MAG TPA: hypothetical protein VFD92_26130 [Candidatus Binatia bacterium]|nr:hypothetical protein [Candidatus Binatia bacterium]